MADKIITRDEIGYSGTVVINIKKGKTIISSRTVHNNGCVNLFKFIANCLKGDFLSSMRPCKICLFSRASTESASASDWNFTKDSAISPYIYMTTAAVSTTIENTASVKYVFRIPYSQITGKVAKIALYDSTPADFTDSRYAYIGLVKNTGTADAPN